MTQRQLVYYGNAVYPIDNPVKWAMGASSPINQRFRCVLLLDCQADLNVIERWLVQAMRLQFREMTLIILDRHPELLNKRFFARNIKHTGDICRYVDLSIDYFRLLLFCKCEENAIIWVQCQLGEKQAVDAALLSIPCLCWAVLLAIMIDFPSVAENQMLRTYFDTFEPREDSKSEAFSACARLLTQ